MVLMIIIRDDHGRNIQHNIRCQMNVSPKVFGYNYSACNFVILFIIRPKGLKRSVLNTEIILINTRECELHTTLSRFKDVS